MSRNPSSSFEGYIWELSFFQKIFYFSTTLAMFFTDSSNSFFDPVGIAFFTI